MRRIPGLSVNDLPIQWRLAREIELRDPVGVHGVESVVITRDGQSYAYSCWQYFSDLFLVEGLR